MGRDSVILTPNELVFIFRGSYVCENFGENRLSNATVRVPTDGYTHCQTDRLTDANRFYNANSVVLWSANSIICIGSLLLLVYFFPYLISVGNGLTEADHDHDLAQQSLRCPTTQPVNSGSSAKLEVGNATFRFESLTMVVRLFLA